MKLKNNQNEYPIISSDDVYMTGESTGKKLSNIINDHEKDINDLKKYTKWLYKYGGTGSKYGGSGEGGGGGSATSLSSTVRFNGTIMTPNKDQQLVLNDEKTVTITGELSNTISTNHYYISIKKGSTYITKSITKNNVKYDEITSDSWFQFNYPATNIDDNTQFVVLITSTGTENKTISYTVNVIKEAYSFTLSFADGNNKQIISTDNDLWIDGSASVRDTGLLLNINYNVIAENPIEYEIVGDDVYKMFDCNNGTSYKGTLNIDAIRKESIYIPFKESFLNDDDSIGYYSITVGFSIKESGQALQTIYKQISFNLIPQNSYFFKVMPANTKQKFYKYNEENQELINSIYEEYDLLYSAYVKLNINNDTLDNKTIVINKIREKYNEDISDSITDEDLKEELQNAVSIFENNVYVYPAGNIKFYVTAYFGTDTSSSIPIEAELNGEAVLIGMTQIELKSKESISFNISQSGIYTFSFYCPRDISKKITYYMYVYDKATEINWYEENVSLQAQNYWRTGSVTPLFQKYNNVYNIQKYNNDTGKTNVVTLLNAGASVDNIGYPQSVNDIMISLGIQYSANNTSVKDPIIEILAKTQNEDDANTNHIKIYQNKIVTNGEDIPIFLPKESLYNVKDNSKYHLLTIYKRFIYNKDDKDYYEICIYLDGCLENAANTFTSNNSPLITINLLPGNFAINLAEISYFMHNDNENEEGIKEYNLPRVASDGTINNISYLDDVAISEYFYKYASVNYNVADMPAYEMVKKTIKQLRGFGEVSNGMIKVSDGSIIADIAKEGTVPVMLFEHSDISKGEFIKFYTSSKGAENAGNHLPLDSLKYSNGHSELIDIQMPTIPGQGNLEKLWYIELQGSSTLLNFAKNLNVGIEQKIGGYMILFTPNFKYVNFNDSHTSTEEKKQAKNSYLPETKFTLKTDQVDSTHSNNTAIGAFVNENTTPFVSSTSNNYSNYIKNCLLGFPVLVFMKVNEYANENEARNESYYFLGIMNFNLGRDSYFNMGYYDSEVLSQGQCNNELTQLDGSTFKTVYIETGDSTATELTIRPDVMVAEIQGGDNHFDFSQARKSVLFPNDSNDTHVMFGDFVPRYTYGASDRDLKMQAHLHRLVENISLSGGYLFEMIGKHFGEYSRGYNAYINDGINTSIYNSANQVPNYMIQYERIPGKGEKGEPLYSIPSDGFRPIRNDDEKFDSLRRLILDYSDEVESYNAILDYKSVSEYYVVCMAFGLVDSVMKNLNVKTWNASSDISNDKIYGKWFTAFYDMDTAFGRNNGGTATSYFAFSDYWFNPSQSLSVATIYRDFFPKADETFSTEAVKNIGYDVPSSYLFAIAKYAPLAFGNAGTDLDLFDTLRQHTPQNIWARWRTINNDPLTVGKLGSTGLSELKNADYFINKYFIRNLDEIPEQIWNMNYRLKYLKRIKEDSTLTNGDLYTWDTTSGSYELTLNKRPFHGKGIYELREWLSGRFHILDAYFNIEGCGKNNQYPILKLNYNGTEIENTLNPDNRYSIYDSQSGDTYTFWTDNLQPKRLESDEYDWVYSGYYDNTPDDTIQSLYTNEDIILLSDIFSASRQGNKYDNNIYLKFKAKEYSPILVVNAMGALAKYLIENPNNIYSLIITKTGTTNSLLGGASNWTEIENLNSLIVEGNIYIKSNNLETFTLSQGKCRSYTLLTPALKEVSITEPADDEANYTEFTGNLTFSVENGNDSYPCLDKVDISRTSINLKIKEEGVKTVNAYKITSQYLSLRDCANLSNVNLNNAQINTCEILPGWSNNIIINSSRIKKLDISPKDKTQSERKIVIKEDTLLSELTLTDFTHIEISDCRNLEKLTINSIDQVKSLKIMYCNTIQDESTKAFKKFKYTFTPSKYADSQESYTNYETNDGIDTIIDETNNCMNLSGAESLELLSIEGTRGINSINFGNITGESYEYRDSEHNVVNVNGINLAARAFMSTQVKQILINESNPLVLFINGPATFSNCSYEYGYNQLFVKARDYESPSTVVSSLAHMFSITDTSTLSSKLDIIKVSTILGNANIADYKSMIYENKDNIKDISYMFYNQTGIRVDGDSWINDLKRLSLKSFKYVQNISYIYANCNVNKLSSDIFGEGDEYLGSALDENSRITITSFISTSATIDIHTFKYIINKISSFISTEERPMGLKLCEVIDEYNIASNLVQPLAVRELFKTRMPDGELVSKQLPNIVSIIGFNIEGQLDWNNAFLDDDEKFIFPNLGIIRNSFNRSIGTETTYNKINDNIDNWGLDKKLEVINTIKNSFNIALTTPINYNNVINLNIDAYHGIVPATETEFNMPKYIEENKFINILKESNNSLLSLDYKFYNIVILKADENDNEFKTHDADVTIPYKFQSCNYAFTGMKFKTSISGESIPIKLTSDSLKYFTNCGKWDYAFANITLAQNLPLNLFNQHNVSTEYTPANYTNKISSLEGTFSGIRIDSPYTYFRHEEYDDICIEENGIKKLNVDLYNNGDVLDGSYNPIVEITGLLDTSNLLINNPKCKNYKMVDSEKVYDGEDLKTHLILPFDIFWGCGNNANVKKCFANSDFEGILPSRLLEKNKDSVLNNTFNNLLVIPNRITNSYGQDYIYLENFLLDMNTIPTISANLMDGVLNYLRTNDAEQTYINNFDNLGDPLLIKDLRNTEYEKVNYIIYQRHKTYVFVPRGFTSQVSLDNAFTFKVILPKSVANVDKDLTENLYNSLYEHYFVFTDNSIPEKSIISIKSALPGASQLVSNGQNDNDYELYYIDPTLGINDGKDNVPSILNSRKYHNIHYSLMLREPDDNNQNFTETDPVALTKAIVRKIRQDIDTDSIYTGNINYFENSLGSGDDLIDAPFNIISRYGISYYNYGMTLTSVLRQIQLSGFMNKLLLRFLFGNLFINDTSYTIPVNTKPTTNDQILPIFEGVEEVSVYVKMPYVANPESARYDNLLTVNFGYENRAYVAISVYNCGGNVISYENYVNRNKYILGNMPYPFNNNDMWT